MKSRTLIVITASLITVAAILLTAGLSLLHGSAFEATFDEVAIDEVIENVADEHIGEILATEDEIVVLEAESSDVDAPVVDVPEIEDPIVDLETPKYYYPDFEYNLVNAKDIHYCGCEQDNPYTSHYELLKGITIDIYSHKTGELVGQLALESEKIENYISNLMAEEFDPWAQTFEPNSNDEAVNLPNGDYRIEVYAGTWFSYTYGNNSMYELTQCTLTFYGGEKITGYIDYLIADYIAQIKSGNVEKPNPEMAVSKLEYNGLEGYWYGYTLKDDYIDLSWEGAGRFTERFPYLEN